MSVDELKRRVESRFKALLTDKSKDESISSSSLGNEIVQENSPTVVKAPSQVSASMIRPNVTVSDVLFETKIPNDLEYNTYFLGQDQNRKDKASNSKTENLNIIEKMRSSSNQNSKSSENIELQQNEKNDPQVFKPTNTSDQTIPINIYKSNGSLSINNNDNVLSENNSLEDSSPTRQNHRTSNCSLILVSMLLGAILTLLLLKMITFVKTNVARRKDDHTDVDLVSMRIPSNIKEDTERMQQ